jgi:biotin carboxyl carrier protein
MKTVRLIIVWISFVLVFPETVFAFDKILHSDVVYAAAVANGFSRKDAALIADASQSLDDNPSTTAFDWELIFKEAAGQASGTNQLDRLPHMISGQIYHAMGDSKVRAIVEEGHLKRIAQARAEIKSASSDTVREQKRLRALLYLGEYLHFLADTVVHPKDPLLGHFVQGTDPDRGDRHPQTIRIATSLMSRQLALYNKGSALEKTPPSAEVRVPNRLHDNPEKNRFLEAVAETVKSSWNKTYPDELPYTMKNPDSMLSKALRLKYGPGETYSAYVEIWDDARKARAHSEIDRVVKKYGYSLREHGYQKIELDENGDPIGKQADRFGKTKEQPGMSFAKNLAEDQTLADERMRNAGIQTIRAMGGALESLSLPARISNEILQEARKAAVWRPPSGPGGIALDPGLVMPEGIGEPKRITMDGPALVLVTSQGRFVFEGIDPRSFATLSRTVAAGEIPFITIGSTPSDREGYARALYSPSLIGTWEGAVLYESDILFKAVFSRFPFGPDYVFNRPESNLYRTYPGAGGESMRLWITSRRVVLEKHNGVLAPAQHGMRILSETILDRRPQADPELEAYASRLTADWNRLAEKLWPFRAVQDMARATAIVFWARSEGVPIDPLIFTLPARTGFTPAYAPIVGVLADRSFAASGGVALTPEDKSTTTGRTFLNWMRSTLLAPNQNEEHPVLVTSLLVLLFAALALGFLFICSLLLWGACRFLSYPRVSLKQAIKVWTLICFADFVLAAAAAPFVREGGPLCYFDADMLAFFVTIVAFPWLLLVFLSRFSRTGGSSSSVRPEERKPRRPVIGISLVALGLLGPICNISISTALALATAAASRPVSGPIMNTLLTYELAPADVLSAALLSIATPLKDPWKKHGNIESGIFILPRSLLYSQRPPFENASQIPSSSPEELTNPSTFQNPALPFTVLQRIRWPDDMPVAKGLTHYSPDGKAPFDSGPSGGKFATTGFAADEQIVVSEVNAVVEAIPVKVGDRVKAGDVLAKMDATAILREAEQAKTSYERMKALHAAGAVPDEELAKAETEYRFTQGRISKYTITAPVDGTVAEVLCDVGEALLRDSPVVKLTLPGEPSAEPQTDLDIEDRARAKAR